MNPKIHIAHVLNGFVLRALAQSEVGTIDVRPLVAVCLAIFRNFNLVGKREAIHLAGIPPIAITRICLAIPTLVAKTCLEQGINWWCTALALACLARAPTITNFTLLPVCVAAHLRPETSGMKALRDVVRVSLARHEFQTALAGYIRRGGYPNSFTSATIDHSKSLGGAMDH